MRIIKSLVLTLFIIALYTSAFAQSLPVGSLGTEDYFRRMQLLGTDTTVSFMVRPIIPNYINKSADVFYPDTAEHRDNTGYSNTWLSKNGKLKTVLLPMSYQGQINSHHPYGWNDGAMIPNTGIQVLASGGVFMQYGHLTFQFKPEIVLGTNIAFSNLDTKHYEVLFARYYDIYNNIDMPVQFGNDPNANIYWGQSSLRYNFNSLSVGLSTENLWWGPGIRNSLLMSNTAPGFKHFTFNTTKPIQTSIGSFEGQIIAGKLEDSGFAPLTPNYTFFGNSLYVPKPKQWRYLTGIVVTWQPKWVPGLFLGFDQTSQSYGKDLHSITDYLPLFSSVKNVGAPDNPINGKDQRSSIFARWLWPEEHAEIYFQWGRSNATSDLTQSLLTPENSRAYIFGLRKLLPFNKLKNENIIIGIEVTQLQQNSLDKIVKGNGSWYVNKYIRQGYTNRGEVLGAGIGPGGNLQSLDISWVKGLKRIGLQFERYVHNNDLYYYIFQDSKDYSRHWVDLSMAAGYLQNRQ